MPEPFRVKGVNAKTCLVEHLVEKRVRTLEYLRTLHTREDVLWMNTVRLGKTEIGEFFGVDRSVLDPRAKRMAPASKCVIRHERTESMSSATTSQPGLVVGGTPTPSPQLGPVSDPVTTVPLRRIQGMEEAVRPEWLEEYMPKYVAFGVSLSELLLVPMSGPDFVDAFYQLFLELDVAFAGGGAARVLAGRTLKNHRWARAQRAAQQRAAMGEEGATTPRATGSASPGDNDAVIVSAKPHFLNDTILQQSVAMPSYDLVVPSLCTTMIFAYRRMCDFDATEDTETVKCILQVDRRCKRLVIGNLSKELHNVAKLRMLQQAFVLTDHVLGAFSQADDALMHALLHSAKPPAPATEGEAEDRDEGEGGSSGHMPGRDPSLDGSEAFRFAHGIGGGAVHADPAIHIIDSSDDD